MTDALVIEAERATGAGLGRAGRGEPGLGGPGLEAFLPAAARPPADGVARARGAVGNRERGPVSEDAVVAALQTVHDPEIPVNIHDLGLIYGVTIDAASGDVAITMTLTAPGCPVAGAMPAEVAQTVAAVPGVGEVAVRLVWDPPWTKDRMSEDARLVLDV